MDDERDVSLTFDWNEEEKQDYSLAEIIVMARAKGAPDDLDKIFIQYAGCGSHQINVYWDEEGVEGYDNG